MNIDYLLKLTRKLSFFLFSAVAISGCAQQQMVSTVSPPIVPSYASAPQNIATPIVGTALPRETSSGVAGFEVHGSGRSIIPPPSGTALSESGGGITFDFVNASVTAVAQTIFGQLLKENYTVDGGVQGTITLQTTRPLSLDEVVPALETSLQMANLALTREADGYHIVPLANAGQASAGNLSIAGGPQTAGYGYEIIPLKYASAASIEKLIQPLAQPNVQIQVDSAHNILIVAGTSQDRAAIAANVTVFDVNWLAGMSYALVPLQNASAGSVVKEVNQIIGSSDNPMNGVVRMVVISQLNAILVISQQDQYLDQIRNWIERLDQQEQSDERQVFIYRLQNGQASEMAKLLNQLLGSNIQNAGGGQNAGGESSSGDNGNENTGNPGDNAGAGVVNNVNSSIGGGPQQPENSAVALTPGIQAAGPSLQQGGGNSSGDQGNSSLITQNGQDNVSNGESIDQNTNDEVASDQAPRISADDTNNDLLIYATADQYRTLQSALVQLDVQPMQVMIEAVVAEVTLTNQLQYGVQYFFQSGRVQSVNTLSATNTISQLFPGFSAILRPGQNIQIALDALESITHVNVISAPKLLVLNNQPAELQVGDEVPITTQTAQSTEAANAPLVSTIQYQPTGVILHVTPRINSGGLVTLDISQEVSEVSSTTTSTLNSPTISERKISTIVAVPDGQTVALGGLIQSNSTIDNSGIPLLGRIPVLGFLFSNRNTSGTRTELLVMITPHVVQSASSLQDVTDSLQNELSEVRP